MGQNEKILIGAVVLAVGVGGYIYVSKKGGLKKIFDNEELNNKQNFATLTPTSSTASTAFKTSKTERTKAIQKRLAEKSYLTVSDVDGFWGEKTNAAFEKATKELNLPKISDEHSFNTWLSAIDNKGITISSVNLSKIAAFIVEEFRSKNTDYEAIRQLLKPLTAKQILALDKIYRDFSPKGLHSDFKTDDAGGKVFYDSYNAKAIRVILADAGLKGLSGIEKMSFF